MSDEQQVDTSAASESQAPNYEQEAQAQGWVPKEKYRGDENDWVDAETFVRRGKEIMPILRKNNEKLLKELAEAKKGAEEARTVAKEFREFQKQQFERKAAELESQLEQLKQAKREAITSGDGDRAIAIDDAMDDLKEKRNEAKQEAKEAEARANQPSQPTIDPELNEWIGRNKWFGADKKLTNIANGLGAALKEEQPHLRGKAFLQALDEQLAEYLPEKLGKKGTPNPMDGGTPSGAARPSGSKGKKSYDNLPAEARAACDRFVKQGLMTKEQYVSEYSWD